MAEDDRYDPRHPSQSPGTEYDFRGDYIVSWCCKHAANDDAAEVHFPADGIEEAEYMYLCLDHADFAMAVAETIAGLRDWTGEL